MHQQSHRSGQGESFVTHDDLLKCSFRLVSLPVFFYGCEPSPEGVREDCVEEDMWAEEGQGNMEVEKTI
jgi:hypothetical protein